MGLADNPHAVVCDSGFLHFFLHSMITFKKCHPRYPKYKPSNTNAIGNIPDGWEVKKLKYMASVCNGSDYKDIEAEDGEYPVYGSGGEFARANAFVYNKPSVLL